MPKDRCQPIRDDIEALTNEIEQLQELLNEVPPSLKPAIVAQIKRERTQFARLQRALRICERAH
jgi:hypothetical protein